ncbi:hypothetical protein KAS14_06545 [Candidatus Bathyarchaeota archaeon]|nr:hypothetical protein [Candidatus Bathyarchaeota archaeon]
MYRPNLKENGSKLNRLAGRLLGALGVDTRSQMLLNSQKPNYNTAYTNSYSYSHMEIKSVLLNVERKKSEVLMARQRRIY